MVEKDSHRDAAGLAAALEPLSRQQGLIMPGGALVVARATLPCHRLSMIHGKSGSMGEDFP